MKTRTIILIVTALIVLSGTALAEAGRERAAGNTRGPGARLCEQLGLSEEQRKQVRDVLQQFHADVKAIVQSDIPKEEKRSKIEPLRTKAADAITAILTPEQQEKVKQMGLVDRLLNPQKRGAGPRIICALAKLDLNETQKAAVKDIFQESREKIKAIRGDTSLDLATKRAKVAELRKETLEKIKTELTPEQREKLEQLLQNRLRSRNKS